MIAYNPSIVTNGLVLYLDAANTKSYPGTGTTWYDLSGNGNNGTLVNGLTYNSANNGSLIFNGVDDYIKGPISTGLSESITIELYIKFLSSISNKIFFGIDTDAHLSLGIFVNPNGLTWYWNTGDAYATPFSNSPILTLNSWYHLAVSTASATNNANLFLNGNHVGVSNYKNTTTTGVGDKYQIGRYFNNTYWTNAEYSIFKIYNRALSATEIAQNFTAHRGRYGI
jgi:hypothetical protein